MGKKRRIRTQREIHIGPLTFSYERESRRRTSVIAYHCIIRLSSSCRNALVRYRSRLAVTERKRERKQAVSETPGSGTWKLNFIRIDSPFTRYFPSFTAVVVAPFQLEHRILHSPSLSPTPLPPLPSPFS